jgi:hypothetical protein
MRMRPLVRKLALTSHVTFSVGWLGAAAAYLALAVVGLTSDNGDLTRAIYLVLDVIGWFVIVPLCFGALISGLVQSLGTEWGLIRHYWILIKLVLTVAATIVLLVHMRTVSHVADVAASANPDFGSLQVQLLVHAGGGVLVLLSTTTLSIYKPFGRTRWGGAAGLDLSDRRNTLLVGGIGLLLLLVVLHLAGALPRH